MQTCKIQFKKLGKKYFFSCVGMDIKDGDYVVVNTVRGLEVGRVSGEKFDFKGNTDELKEVVRKANKDDMKKYEKNKSEEPQIIEVAKKLALKEHLDMKVLAAEYTLDRSKLIIYFQSEERVDFRELVKDLADQYRTRIYLRQVGARDGAKYFGGIGPCGLPMCCQTWLVELNNVSVKMAKNQSLSLTPTKISGNCDKLLCCITYENDMYTELRKNAPDVGDIVMTENGKAKVMTSDVLNRNLKVKYLENEGFGYLKKEDVEFDVQSRKRRQDGSN